MVSLAAAMNVALKREPTFSAAPVHVSLAISLIRPLVIALLIDSGRDVNHRHFLAERGTGNGSLGIHQLSGKRPVRDGELTGIVSRWAFYRDVHAVFAVFPIRHTASFR